MNMEMKNPGTRMSDQRGGEMLWIIAVALIMLWLLGLVGGFTVNSFIDVLCIGAVILLLVSLIKKVVINRRLMHVLRSRNRKPDLERTGVMR
jgi:hypothetical protein